MPVASYILFPHDGVWHIVVCRRGVPDSKYGDLFTAGGAVDRGESLVAAVRRETIEEFGIKLPEKAYSPFMNIGSLTVFVAVLSACPSINGPTKRHAWELLETEVIPGVPNKAGTRLTHVPLDLAITHASGVVRQIMESLHLQYNLTVESSCIL